MVMCSVFARVILYTHVSLFMHENNWVHTLFGEVNLWMAGILLRKAEIFRNSLFHRNWK